MEVGEKRDFVLETLLKEFGDVAREARKVFIKHKMLGFYANFANTLENMEKDRLNSLIKSIVRERLKHQYLASS
jgi:hypothetical protein